MNMMRKAPPPAMRGPLPMAAANPAAMPPAPTISPRRQQQPAPPIPPRRQQPPAPAPMPAMPYWHTPPLPAPAPDPAPAPALAPAMPYQQPTLPSAVPDLLPAPDRAQVCPICPAFTPDGVDVCPTCPTYTPPSWPMSAAGYRADPFSRQMQNIMAAPAIPAPAAVAPLSPIEPILPISPVCPSYAAPTAPAAGIPTPVAPIAPIAPVSPVCPVCPVCPPASSVTPEAAVAVTPEGCTVCPSPAAAAVAAAQLPGGPPITAAGIGIAPGASMPAAPVTLCNLLQESVGHYVITEHLVGTANIVRHEGWLVRVEPGCFVLYDDILRSYLVCDYYSLKFFRRILMRDC